MSPAGGNIFVTITRPGKETKHVEVPTGSTLEYVFQKAGFAQAEYSGWSVTDEEGDSLALNDSLDTTTALVVGARVAGA